MRTLDPTASELIALVRRAGPLAELGHDHVVAAGRLEGCLHWPEEPADRWVRLRFPLAAAAVDEPRLRARFGVTRTVSRADADATQANLLRWLNAAAHPWVEVEGRPAGEAVELHIRLAGREARLRIAPRIREEGDELTAAGRAILRLSAFELAPFTALGGLLRVADEVEIHFTLRFAPPPHSHSMVAGGLPETS